MNSHQNIFINISHCVGGIDCAISIDNPIGVDVEKIRTFRRYALNRAFNVEERDRVLMANNLEREFYIHWTLKESYIKAIGMGLSYPMKNISFRLEDNLIYSNRPKCRFLLIEDRYGYLTACCYMVGKGVQNGKFYRI